MAGRNYQFPVYQIDFSAVAAGKRVAATKRRIRWRFGFPNLKAIEEGRTGTDCRGEEHEVVIIWSVTSGKRQILMDGREIHYSSNRVGILDFSWNTKGNHVLKVTCHAAPPMSANPGFRQYDLFIDGQSFFHMPKVYELGIKGSSAMDRRVPGQPPSSYYGEPAMHSSPRLSYDPSYNNAPEPPVHVPRDAQEEDEELQAAIRASLEEAKKHLNEKGQPDVLSNGDGGAAASGDLLDFDGPSSASSVPAIMPDPSMNSFTSAPQPIAAAPSQPNSYDATGYGYGAPPQQQQQQYPALPPAQYGAPPQQTLQYGAPPQQQFAALPPSQSAGQPVPPAYGSPPPHQAPPPMPPVPPQSQFAPQPSYGSTPGGDSYAGHSIDDPFAPKAPTHNDVANGILKAYGGTSPTSVSSQSHGRYQPGQPFMQLNGSAPPNQGHYPEMNGEAPALSMNGGYAPTPSLTMNALTATEEEPQNPFDAALKKLVNIDHIDEPAEEQLKLTMKKQEDERAKKYKNKSVPLPPAASRVVGSGATLGEISKVKPPAKMESVMKPPPGLFQDDAAMAGALVVHGQGPPPLQPRGFGVVHMQGQYAAQQQAMYARPQQQRYGYR